MILTRVLGNFCRLTILLRSVSIITEIVVSLITYAPACTCFLVAAVAGSSAFRQRNGHLGYLTSSALPSTNADDRFESSHLKVRKELPPHPSRLPASIKSAFCSTPDFDAFEFLTQSAKQCSVRFTNQSRWRQRDWTCSTSSPFPRLSAPVLSTSPSTMSRAVRGQSSSTDCRVCRRLWSTRVLTS